MKFRKRPIVIDATRWMRNGDHPEDFKEDREGGEPIPGTRSVKIVMFSGAEQRERGWEGQIVRYYRRPDDPGGRLCEYCRYSMHDHGWIDTLEGGHIVCPGDWIITGVKGERYPCKPDIFDATYEPA